MRTFGLILAFFLAACGNETTGTDFGTSDPNSGPQRMPALVDADAPTTVIVVGSDAGMDAGAVDGAVDGGSKFMDGAVEIDGRARECTAENAANYCDESCKGKDASCAAGCRTMLACVWRNGGADMLRDTNYINAYRACVGVLSASRDSSQAECTAHQLACFGQIRDDIHCQ
jgi:hypothetical protein